MGAKNFDCDVEELYKWIDGYTLSRSKKNISRDFSDAIPLAEILKQNFPKLVDLHNYSPKNSICQKLINWQTLNKKVLSKLDLTLTSAMMEQLAQSLPGAIEKVLFNVKERIDSKIQEKQNQDLCYIEALSSNLSGSVIPLRQRDSMKTTDHKVIPFDLFQNMEQQLLEKDEMISELKNKIQHMESLLNIKDERITDLTKQVQQASINGAASIGVTKNGSNFFTKLF